MKHSKHILAYAFGIALSIGLIAGCSGGGSGFTAATPTPTATATPTPTPDNFIDDGVYVICADGTATQQFTQAQAESFCAIHGGIASPNPFPTPVN